MIPCSCCFMIENDRLIQLIIVIYSVFVRYYADPNMEFNARSIDHRPKIPSCTIAPKV